MDRRLTLRNESTVHSDRIQTDSNPSLDYILSHCKGDCRDYLEVKIFGRSIKGFLDSGASHTCMGHNGLKIMEDLGIVISTSSSPYCTVANKQQCSISGQCSVPIQICDRFYVIDVLIVPDISHTLILGVNFWIKAGIVPNLKRGIWTFDETEPMVYVNSVVSKDVLGQDEHHQLEDMTDRYFSNMGDKLGRTHLVEHHIVVDSPPLKIDIILYLRLFKAILITN